MRLLKLVIAGAVVSGIASVAQAEVRVIASNPQGSIFYASSVVIGKLLDEKLKIQMRVQPMGGSSTYIPLLDRGEVDFGLTNVDDALSSYKGVGNFKRPSSELRLTAVAFPLTLGVIGPTTIMAYDIFFSTNAKTPDELVYDVVKTLHSNKEELVKGQPVFKDFDPNRMTEEIGVPWHPGAIKFYKEIGQWPAKE